METKLILVDLDLTLLHSDGTLSKRNEEALKKCQEKGIAVGFSTSRGNIRIHEFENRIKPDVIVCNAGACIYYRNSLIHTEAFPVEELRALFKKVYEICGPDAEITADTLNDFYWNRISTKSTMYMPEAVFDDFNDFSQPVMKFCVQTSDKEKAESIIKDFPNCSAIAFSDIPWYKFSPVSATKENAIKFLSDYLKIPAENMVSFGDDFADIGMLKSTGTGIAMGNAIEQVKDIASETALTCDEDGVAVWIEKNILNK